MYKGKGRVRKYKCVIDCVIHELTAVIDLSPHPVQRSEQKYDLDKFLCGQISQYCALIFSGEGFLQDSDC